MLTTRPDGTIIYTPFPDYELEDPPGANNDTTRTTYRLAGQMVGARVKTPTGNTFYYPFTDHLGNVVAMSWRGAGVITNSHARYDPYGNFRTAPTATNPSLTSRGFTGHAHNNTGVYPTQNVGLIYMNARYYMPEIGRFISADTIVPEPGNPQAFNRYGYGLNNPLKYRDPSGHWFESALDVAFIAYDIYDIRQNGLNWVSGLSLAADVVGLIVPVGTGGGVAVRALANGDNIARAATHLDETIGVVNAAANVQAAGRVDNIASSAARVQNTNDPDIVYRVMRADEHPRALEHGIKAKNPDANYLPQYHVSNGNHARTNWISTTRDLDWAKSWQRADNAIYEIDLRQVTSRIVDTTVQGAMDGWHFRPKALAKRASEVLVEGYIPPDAIRSVINPR